MMKALGSMVARSVNAFRAAPTLRVSLPKVPLYHFTSSSDSTQTALLEEV